MKIASCVGSFPSSQNAGWHFHQAVVSSNSTTRRNDVKPLITSGKWHDANTSANARCRGMNRMGGRMGGWEESLEPITPMEDERLEPTNEPNLERNMIFFKGKKYHVFFFPS